VPEEIEEPDDEGAVDGGGDTGEDDGQE